MKRFAAPFCEKIICISDAEKQSALDKKICKEDKLQVIFNGVDIEAYENGAHGAVKRQDLNIPEDAFVVGMVGRISQQKAPDVFIKMAKQVKDEVLNAHFIIVGNGNQEDEIRKYAKDNGFSDSLHVTGWVDDPMSYVELFDVACLLSRWEGFGLALPEYMMAGKPIVASRVDAIPNIIRDGENGLLVEVDDDTGASNAVLRIKKMFSIKAAVPLIKYSWKVMMTDLLGTLCNNLGDFIIGAKYNSANLAYYTKGKQLPQLFRTNIYTTLISVLFPGIAAVNDNMITVKKITRKSVRIMAYIVFPISLGLMAAGDTIIEVLFTEKWLPMLPYVYVMCVETIISVPATIALQPIKAVGRSDLMLKSEIIKKIFFMISTVVAMNYGVFAIALTVPANTLLDLTINTIINKKIINYSIFEELSDCFTAFTLSLMMAAIVVFIGKIELNIYVKVVIQILTGVLSYAGVSYLTKNKEFIYILNVGIKHFKNV